MRILIINDYGSLRGGAEIAMLSLRDGLRTRGHDARLFASNASDGDELMYADYSCLGTTSRWRTLLQTTNPWAYAKLREVLADFKPHVVHVCMFLTRSRR